MDKGTYALIAKLDSQTTVSVGKLGRFNFPPGYYMYFGSALGGLSARIARHLRRAKRLHWHIDYLLQSAEVIQVWSSSGDERLECEWYHTARDLPLSQDIVPGFGSSDCTCPSHLVYSKTEPSFDLFRKRLEERGLQLNEVRVI